MKVGRKMTIDLIMMRPWKILGVHPFIHFLSTEMTLTNYLRCGGGSGGPR